MKKYRIFYCIGLVWIIFWGFYATIKEALFKPSSIFLGSGASLWGYLLSLLGIIAVIIVGLIQLVNRKS